MADFPELTYPPEVKIDSQSEDAANKTELGAGYQSVRPSHTRDRETIGPILYKSISTAERATIKAFETNVRGTVGIFNWTHPETQVVHAVRFRNRPRYTSVAHDQHDIEFTLQEV